MRYMMRISPAIVVLIAGSCAGTQQSRDRLDEALLFFHTHLRSGDFDRASAYVAPEAFEAFSSLHDPARNLLQIEDFTVASVLPDADGKKAIVMVTADVRRRDSITMRTMRYRQVWQERGGRWRLTAEEAIVAR